MNETAASCDVGMIGLGVMGSNLALNLADHGYRVAGYDRSVEVAREFVVTHASDRFPRGGSVWVCQTMRELIGALPPPRIIVVMVPAGPPVDSVCAQLIESGVAADDIVVDGGNSLWTDTIEREKRYRGQLTFFGSGVSGGEIGARFGPSLMPGGDRTAWKRLKPVWESIAAKVDPRNGKPIEGATPGHPISGGEPCTAYIGPGGAGHYVKMVHNGIEYADMQLICEAYFIMSRLLGMKPDEMSEVFAAWNEDDLDSFLIQITADILQQRDPGNRRKFIVDMVLDTAGQKGTGKWTSVNALDMGVPSATITEAVFARIVSALKEQRIAASKSLKGPRSKLTAGRKRLIEAIRDALYCSKICAYAQGFAQLAETRSEYQWELNLGAIAMIWRGGCIIRARFLQKIKEAFEHRPDLPNLMLDPYFRRTLAARQDNWRRVVALAAETGVACPCFMSALSYYDSYRTATLPANLLQAQRDYFGAHGFERVDQPRGVLFHVDWPNPQRPMINVKS